MLGLIKLPLAGAVVGIALAVTIAVASADLGVTVERAGAITGSSLGALTFRSPLATVTCNLSLTGSLGRSAGFEGYAGSASRASVSSCTGGTVTARTETPWDIIYERPLGTLPRLTELAISLDNVDLLFDVNFFGVHVRCEMIGHFETLTPLTAEGERFRTGLSTIQATGQDWRVYTELDTSGLCPRGEEISASGRLQINPLQQIFAIPLPMGVTSPAHPITYGASETRTITFRNETTGMVTVERVRMDFNSRFTIPGGNTNQCLTQPGETSKTIAAGGTCTVDVTFTNLLTRVTWYDTLRLLTNTGGELGRAFLRHRP